MWWRNKGVRRAGALWLCVMALSVGSAQAQRGTVIDPALAERLSAEPAEPVAVLAYLESADEPVLPLMHATDLRATAAASQAALRVWLAQQSEVVALTPLWIVNAIALTAPPALLHQLAARPEIRRLALDEITIAPAVPTAPLTVTSPLTNHLLINAPLLWNQNITGTGVTIAFLDSGVDVSHPDLAGNFRGASGWYDPYTDCATPCDLTGHGTQVVGVAVGQGGTGVAPGAQWMAAKIYPAFGQIQTSKIHLAFQWVLDPDDNPATADAPQVVNNSWNIANVGCDLEFAPDIQALLAANILPVFSAGNLGAGGVYTTSVSPANNPGALAVGATDLNDAVWANSSRGPTACGGAERTYPDLAAPGVSITTTDRLPGPGYVTQLGTSMAAPHVTGALALLLSVYPHLSVEQQRALLLHAAQDLSAPGADNDTGAGRLDVWAAHQSVRQLFLPLVSK